MTSNVNALLAMKDAAAEQQREQQGEAAAPLAAARKNLFFTGAADEPYGTPGAGNSRLLSVVTVLSLLAVWTLVTEKGMVSSLFLPSPRDVLAQFVAIAEHGFAGASLLEHLLASMRRVFGAFALAVLTAVPVGIMIGCSRWVRGIFDPLIEFYRPLPPLAYLPLIIIWMGIDEGSKITLIYLAMFAPIAISARAGVKSVRIEQIQAAYTMGASRWQVIRHIIVIAALPEILTGMRIAIGFGWTTLVAAEMVAAEAGIGFMVLNASEFLATDVVLMGIILIGLIAYTFDRGMLFIERKLVPWKGY
ncbi:taurine transport system permease protein [Sinobacterium caligoides]|uniref:Taurine transport system permease protein n=1 Tax=Sinobacterium caligoides TaxID=933926 RepID=A0A3N2DQ08_9GAMM|nr:ABC transporter permease subunit [Sinobacterium caligoides]ROS01709.1 taurine transport system permease protein [Sinobacterium caligoides]